MLEDVARERGPHVAERQLREELRERGRLDGRGPGLLDDLVAGLLAQRPGEEPDGAHEAALVEQLLEVLAGLGVAFATACFERLREALQQLLPGRDAESSTNNESGATALDLFDE